MIHLLMDSLINSGAIICFYLSIFVFTKKNRAREDLYLFLYFFLNGVIFLIYFISKEYKSENLLFFFININLLLTPIWYLYLKLLMAEDKRIKISKIKHFSLYFITTILLGLIAISIPEDMFDYYINLPMLEQPLLFMIISLAEMIYIPLYLILVIKLLLKHNRDITQIFSYSKGVDLKWVRILVLIELLSWLFSYVPYFLNIEYSLDLTMSLNGVLILYFGYFGIKQSLIVKSIEKKDKYKKASMDKALTTTLKDQLITYMEGEKPYLDDELNIYKLSTALNISSHNLSQLLSLEVKKSFYDFVNEYRVKEFQEQIQSGKNKQYTLLAISMDCGFSSKSTFNRIFKKVTDMTPTQYINTLT